MRKSKNVEISQWIWESWNIEKKLEKFEKTWKKFDILQLSTFMDKKMLRNNNYLKYVPQLKIEFLKIFLEKSGNLYYMLLNIFEKNWQRMGKSLIAISYTFNITFDTSIFRL